MHLHDFDTIPVRQLAPGFRGRYAHSEQVTQGLIEADQGATIPDHSHPHEQWTMVMAGSLELTVAGTPHVLTPGKVLYIAPNERHSARALTTCTVFDVFHPTRDDYR
jgi:quercetin dioxygenase-like cupin family protein